MSTTNQFNFTSRSSRSVPMKPIFKFKEVLTQRAVSVCHLTAEVRIAVDETAAKVMIYFKEAPMRIPDPYIKSDQMFPGFSYTLTPRLLKDLPPGTTEKQKAFAVWNEKLQCYIFPKVRKITCTGIADNNLLIYRTYQAMSESVSKMENPDFAWRNWNSQRIVANNLLEKVINRMALYFPGENPSEKIPFEFV